MTDKKIEALEPARKKAEKLINDSEMVDDEEEAYNLMVEVAAVWKNAAYEAHKLLEELKG